MRESNRLGREAQALGLAPSFEIVPPDDSRAQVANTLQAPYRWVCLIEMKFRSDGTNKIVRGTGILVSPRHVLTSAHLFDARSLSNSKMTVAPARNGSSKPFGEARVTRRRTSPHYRRADVRFDFALLTLDKRIGDATTGKPPARLGHWGETAAAIVGLPATTAIRNMDVEVAGYPGDKPLGTLWSATGLADVAASNPRRVEHTADTKPSMSGGPVFTRDNGVPTLIGLHSMPGVINIDPRNVQTLKNNFATRLTDDVLKQVNDWIAADGP
jgi:V8-like Glu-specific endopeptidase